MAYADERRTYDLTPEQKTSMIMILDQFPEWLETVKSIRWSLTVSGAVCITSHEAVILAGIIAPYYSDLAERLIAPLNTIPAMSPDEWRIKWHETLERVA